MSDMSIRFGFSSSPHVQFVFAFFPVGNHQKREKNNYPEACHAVSIRASSASRRPFLAVPFPPTWKNGFRLPDAALRGRFRNRHPLTICPGHSSERGVPQPTFCRRKKI